MLRKFFSHIFKCFVFINKSIKHFYTRSKFNKLGKIVILSAVLVFFYTLNMQIERNYMPQIEDSNKSFDVIIRNNVISKRYFEKRKKWKTSNLGSVLFKNTDPKQFVRSNLGNKTFVVLIWKYWNWLKKRHLYSFGSTLSRYSTGLEKCSVKNCVFSGNDKHMNSADAIVIHMQHKLLPKVHQRNYKQRWIFLSDESPKNTFSLAKRSNLTWEDLDNVFNWTMTYRTDADIPVPYGRVVPRIEPVMVGFSRTEVVLNMLVPYWNKKSPLSAQAMVIMSNCVDNRIQFIRGLQNYIQVDIIGGCADKKENKIKCPGHFKTDCMLPANYLFYLVLENTKCHQYITEKIFQHAYSKGAIPVIMGIRLKDCKNLLPPDSYLHVDNYKNIQELAEHMEKISKDLNEILFFHDWRKFFEIANEHGFFKTRSYHLCRICEALNYNDDENKTYSAKELHTFFSKELLCDLSIKKIY